MQGKGGLAHHGLDKGCLHPGVRLAGLTRGRTLRRVARVDDAVECCGLVAGRGIDIVAETTDTILILSQGKPALPRGSVAPHEAPIRFLGR